MSEQGFNFSKFIEDSKNAIVNPKEYFASMAVTGGLGEPVIKALIYGAVGGVFTLIWGLLHLSGISGAFMGIGSAVGFMAFIWSLIGALIGLFIGGVIILVLSAICNGSTDYEANARVAASLMVLSPVNAFLGFFSSISITLGLIIGLLVNLYGIWMLYHALNGALKGKPESSKVLSIVLAAILVLFMLIGLGTKRAMTKYGSDLEDIARKYENMADDYTKAAEKVAEDAGKNVEETVTEIMEESSGKKLKLELSGGEILENPSARILKSKLLTLGVDNDFAVISRGDDFLEAAVSDPGFYLEYKDETGYFASATTDNDMETVVRMFQHFIKNDSSWKDQIEWKPKE